MLGEMPAGRRKKIAAAGARRAPQFSRSNRTAFAGRPPPPCLQQEARSAARRDREPGNAHHPVLTARGNADPCPGRAAAPWWCGADPGPARRIGPGSAVHRFTLHCVRGTKSLVVPRKQGPSNSPTQRLDHQRPRLLGARPEADTTGVCGKALPHPPFVPVKTGTGARVAIKRRACCRSELDARLTWA